MIRVTIDANVLAPGATSERGTSRSLIDSWRAGAFTLVLSEHILQELERTLADPYFAARLSRSTAVQIVELFAIEATIAVSTFEVRGVATHPEDDAVLSTAVNGRADFLCTFDKQLLKIQAFHGVEILTPGRLLTHLSTRDDGGS
ncbi:MAG: putative toxin-antitoxin system toxin component, PIN family [Chloroflexota bacterium]|nr:putative toxin-antitoxin system toxin component, PIN family [Chloroflexota bacterium]